MSIIHRYEVRRAWQVHLGNEIEVDQLDTLRNQYKAKGLRPPSYTALVIKAIADSIRELIPTHPQLNAMIAGIPGWRWIHTFDRISMGVAVSRDDDGEDGVTVGVIEDPDQLTAVQISERLQELATIAVKEAQGMRNCYYIYRAPWPLQWFLAKLGHKIPDYRRRYRGTVSLTTVGKFGVDWQLSLPQAGATIQFGFGNIRERPIVRDGNIVAAKTLNLTLSFDRLLMNGRPCAQLLESIRASLSSGKVDCGEPPTSNDPTEENPPLTENRQSTEV